jgi:hypothetical protein
VDRVLALLGALLISSAACAHELEGYWMSDADLGAGTMVLRVAAAPDGKLGAAFRPVHSARWESVDAGSLRLDAQGRLTGKLAGAAVALVRTTLPDIHQWAADNPVPAARARRDSAIEVLYVAAPDCGWCRRWEAKYLEQQKPAAALGWEGVRYHRVDIGSFREHFDAMNVPSHLSASMAKTLQADGSSRVRGTPWFAVFVNGELRAHALGVNAFETLIQPSIKAALREKAS